MAEAGKDRRACKSQITRAYNKVTAILRADPQEHDGSEIERLQQAKKTIIEKAAKLEELDATYLDTLDGEDWVKEDSDQSLNEVQTSERLQEIVACLRRSEKWQKEEEDDARQRAEQKEEYARQRANQEAEEAARRAQQARRETHKQDRKSVV